VTGFVDVLLRSLILAAQAASVGGVVFALWTLRAPHGRVPPAPHERGPDLARAWTLVAAGAGVLVIAQSLSALTQVIALEGTVRLRDLVVTSYFRVSAARVLAALVLLAGALGLQRVARVAGPVPTAARAAVITAVAALVLLAPWTSHAAARVDGRFTLLTLDAVHQVAAWIWIGGLAQLVVVAARGRAETWPPALLRRFSTQALVSVLALVLAGGALSLLYIDGLRALLGTAYGVMVLTKAVLLGALLVLGALNFFVVRRLARGIAAPLRLRRFVEVELGLGLTVLGAAASLTSLPPAIDVVADRATFAEVGGRFVPRWPTLRSPQISELPVDDRNAPRTDADRQWSEYNHHWSGLFVLSMGLLALLHQTGRARWARHWPLIFLGLAIFLFFRSDPGSWPIGPYGFWESMRFPEVLQHRIFLLLVVVFGLFEWRVRTGRLAAPGYALVFPLLCAVGGGLLLTHSHASLNLKSEFLVEVTHAPLGLFGIVVGWGRWLELRLARGRDRLPARLWALGLTAVGLLLLVYRES
jgi:putative copper resistance protein D